MRKIFLLLYSEKIWILNKKILPSNREKCGIIHTIYFLLEGEAVMRKTKIICTIGPASEHEEVLTAMCQAGMNVARLNFSHGSHDEHKKKIELIKKVRDKLQLPIAIGLSVGMLLGVLACSRKR